MLLRRLNFMRPHRSKGRMTSLRPLTLRPRRRVMAANTLKEILCLRNWYTNGIIDFKTLKMFEHVV